MSLKKSIFNIESEYLELIEKAIEQEGVLDDETANALAINKDEMENKGVNYAFLIKSLENQNTAIDGEAARYAKMKKVNTNLINRLKKTVGDAMNLYEIEEIKGEFIKINFRKSTKVMPIYETMDVMDLHENLRTTTKTTKPNLKEIGNVLKSGEKVDGYELRKFKNIQIK